MIGSERKKTLLRSRFGSASAIGGAIRIASIR